MENYEKIKTEARGKNLTKNDKRLATIVYDHETNEVKYFIVGRN